MSARFDDVGAAGPAAREADLTGGRVGHARPSDAATGRVDPSGLAIAGAAVAGLLAALEGR